MPLAVLSFADGVTWVVLTDPANFRAVKEAIAAADIAIENAELAFIPATTVQVTGETAGKLLTLIDNLDDVQKVHANFEIPESEFTALEG